MRTIQNLSLMVVLDKPLYIKNFYRFIVVIAIAQMYMWYLIKFGSLTNTYFR